MTTPETDAQRLARRYPRPRTPRWLWIPAAAAFGGLVVVWSVWAGWHGAHPDVVADVHGFNVVSDTQIDVLVTVQRDPALVDRAASCTVKASAISYDTVGQLPFTWQPTGEELQSQWVSVRTFKRAVTAEVEGCTLAP